MHHKETANGYLERIAKAGIVRKKTKSDIARSIGILSSKLQDDFGSQIKWHGVFGSYRRKTMLPRFMDAQSDVDYMIQFARRDVKPQAFLQRLRRFTQNHYKLHEIISAHPAIVLELNHIRFELVPAVEGFWSDYLIPAKTTEMDDWQATEIKKFEEQLTSKNTLHHQQILPLIRILKYWNVLHLRPFGSYELEQAIVETGYRSPIGLWFNERWSLLTYLNRFVETYEPQTLRRLHAVNNLRQTIRKVVQMTAEGNHHLAIGLLGEFLPMPN